MPEGDFFNLMSLNDRIEYQIKLLKELEELKQKLKVTGLNLNENIKADDDAWKNYFGL